MEFVVFIQRLLVLSNLFKVLGFHIVNLFIIRIYRQIFIMSVLNL